MTYKNRFVVVVTLLIFFLGAAALAQGPELPRAALEHAIAVQELYTDAFMADPEVVGTGVGVGANGEPVIKVYVMSPSSAGLRGALDGVPVITQLMGEVHALKGPPPGKGGGNGQDNTDPPPPTDLCQDDTTARCDRPVPTGVSTGHPAITAGTICCRVKDSLGYIYALSNNHVYAATNVAHMGDAVIQPGTFDGGSSSADDIGTLYDFEYIDFSLGANNVIDAAIASTTPSLLGNATPSDGYGTPKSTPIEAIPGMRVIKYGRTTKQTKGRVDSINATINVNYGAPSVARFVNQIVIIPGNFSAGGDSGSLIVVQKGPDARKPVGLLFAGSMIVTIANPIDKVLSLLGVTIDGE